MKRYILKVTLDNKWLYYKYLGYNSIHNRSKQQIIQVHRNYCLISNK